MDVSPVCGNIGGVQEIVRGRPHGGGPIERTNSAAETENADCDKLIGYDREESELRMVRLNVTTVDYNWVKRLTRQKVKKLVSAVDAGIQQ